MQQSRKEKPSNYLQNRILALILLFVILIGIIVTTLSTYLYKNYLQKSLLQNAESNLRFLSDHIDNSIDNIKRLVDFCKTNTTIGQFTEEGKSSSALSLKAYERLSEQVASSKSEKYMQRVLVMSNTGSYLQIISSNTYIKSLDSYSTALKLPYYEKLLHAPGYEFDTGFVEDSFYGGNIKTSVLPVIRPIYARYNAASTGWILIYITDELFTDPISYYTLPEDSALYLTLGEHNYMLSQSGCEEAGSQLAPEAILETDYLQSDTQAFYVTSAGDQEQLLVISRPFSSLPGCFISQTISKRDLNTQKTLFFTTITSIILLIVIIGMIVSYLLYRSISVPVLQIRNRMTKISMGDFTRDMSIEWNHELGDIGRGINDMSENISELINHRLADERQKRDLEYKMLQSQINPHFIYNTLNSIKWMASIQGADGIAEMTTSLSRLLKSISKGTSLLVPISEELSLLRDYFTIQQYRYGGTISLDIQVTEEALTGYQIVKFTLQPLVENAIFHGIEPKGSAGTITVTVEEASAEEIRVIVADDGVGMSQEKAARLLLDDSEGSADFFRELGVSNVHKRLQYEFGPRYGITVETSPGEYTRMILLLPKRTLKEQEREEPQK